MALVVAPAAGRAIVHGLADLPDAGGGDRAPGLVKLQAGRVPGQAQEVDQPPALVFLIGDQFLILHFHHLQWQNFQPVSGDSLRLEILVGTVGQVIGVKQSRWQKMTRARGNSVAIRPS
jgi:hypothetical protein